MDRTDRKRRLTWREQAVTFYPVGEVLELRSPTRTKRVKLDKPVAIVDSGSGLRTMVPLEQSWVDLMGIEGALEEAAEEIEAEQARARANA